MIVELAFNEDAGWQAGRLDAGKNVSFSMKRMEMVAFWRHLALKNG